jgi:apolipoprotein N-acyltransferase
MALAAIALSALLWWFGSGTEPIWWLTWLAPLPLLWLAPRVGVLGAALAAFVAYGIGGINLWTYLHGNIGLPTSVIVTFIGTIGLLMAACVSLFRRLLLQGRILAAVVSVPALWVGFEYINSLLSPHATFFNIGYTQADVLPIIQLVAVTGLWGVSFLLMLLPTVISLQMGSHATRRVRWAAAGVTALAIIATLVYGGWRLREPPTSTLRVGLVSLKERGQPSLPSEDGDAREARYLDAMNRLADGGANVVLIPEASFATTALTIPAFAALATQRHMTVASGVAYQDSHGDAHNMLTVFQPNASTPATYSKHHLLLGLEQFTPGDRFMMLKGTPRIGLAICKDMDFHDIGHAYADRRAQLLLVPASDFDVDGWLHSRMAIMRGVESGFAVARAARSGRLTLSDDRGRVVAEASSEQRYAELLGDVPLHETTTIYTRWGDWFAWLDLIVLGAVLVLAFVPRSRRAFQLEQGNATI